MKNIPLFLVALLVLMIPSAFAQGREHNMKVNFSVTNGQGLDTNYVGDYFTYNVYIENNDTDPISATFTVNVFNTTHGLLSTRPYVVTLDIGKCTYLNPNFTMNGQSVQSIFYFDTPGAYELEITSSIPVLFYTYFSAGRFVFQHNVATFFFDALPSSMGSSIS